MSIGEAKALCHKTPECAAFSVHGVPAAAGDAAAAWIYFKAASGVCAARDWQTYVKGPNGVPPLAKRRQLQRVFAAHDPARLPLVVPILTQHRGREAQCVWDVQRHYYTAAPDPHAALLGGDGLHPPPLPAGWTEVESPAGDLFYKHSDGRRQWEPPHFAAQL